MKKLLYPVICVFMIVLTTSCASIVSKSEWPVKITSTPESANVSITELKTGKKIFEGKTPATVKLSTRGGYFRGVDYKLEMIADGYIPQNAEISSTLNGWYFGNIIFGGLIGLFIVDPLTGAMWTLDPKDMNLILSKKDEDMAGEQKAITIVKPDETPK